MKELSLHILDIVQNSVVAQATKVEVLIKEDMHNDILEIIINDNGIGMSPSVLQKVIDPFYTSRTTRKVGLGIPLFKANAEACDGSFTIDSQVGKGTFVKAVFRHGHIDRSPLGDMIATFITILSGNPERDFIFKYVYNKKEFVFDTVQIKKNLEDISIDNPIIIDWVRGYLSENIAEIKKA